MKTRITFTLIVLLALVPNAASATEPEQDLGNRAALSCLDVGVLFTPNTHITDPFHQGKAIHRCVFSNGCFTEFYIVQPAEPTCESKSRKHTVSPLADPSDKLMKCRAQRGCDEKKGCQPKRVYLGTTCVCVH